MAARTIKKKLPLVVVVGPTASGKTSLAIDLAKKYGGEIICADSRTIYRDMDIGTAKPTATERATVPHWGLGLVDPGESFNAASFKQYALKKIAEIRERNHIPFLVGGSGLYIDAVVFDYTFAPDAAFELREKLEKLSVKELQEYCIDNNISQPENNQNKRYLIRAIERKDVIPQRRSLPINTSIIVGIATDRDVLRKRIAARAEQIFDDNVVEEATLLGNKYGWDNEAMTGNIYPLIHQYLMGHITFQQMKEKFIVADWRLAKRQLTWLKRNPHIKWLSLEDARHYLDRQLAKK
jgi:tRNA dimethylallyltransferase